MVAPRVCDVVWFKLGSELSPPPPKCYEHTDKRIDQHFKEWNRSKVL